MEHLSEVTRRYTPKEMKKKQNMLAAAGSQGPKPETQIFPRSRSLSFSPRCRVVPFILTNATIRPKHDFQPNPQRTPTDVYYTYARLTRGMTRNPTPFF